jgi:hypothetical protein
VLPLAAAQCSGVALHGRRRRGLGRRTPPIRRSGNGAPVAVCVVHVGVESDERSDDSAIAEDRRPVQRGAVIAVHGGAGVRGWAPRGYSSTLPVPENKTAGSPRGSTAFSFWQTLTAKSTPSGLGALAISLPARASTKRAKLQKAAETAKEAARNRETRQDGRGAYESRNLTS